MAREFRSFLVITADKTSSRRSGKLFQRYKQALGRSPQQFFRMRDADALVRFTIAAALACNDVLLCNDEHEGESPWFNEEQLQVLCEIALIMYDAIAAHKHQAEAEVNSTFRYAPREQRVIMYERCREICWALDMAWLSGQRHVWPIVAAFVRFFGGPIHMTMRRYRFVEDGLTIGKAVG